MKTLPIGRPFYTEDRVDDVLRWIDHLKALGAIVRHAGNCPEFRELSNLWASQTGDMIETYAEAIEDVIDGHFSEFCDVLRKKRKHQQLQHGCPPEYIRQAEKGGAI